MTDVPFPAPEDAKMIASALRQLDWSGASIGHKTIALAAAEALEKLPLPPVAPAGDREAVDTSPAALTMRAAGALGGRSGDFFTNRIIVAGVQHRFAWKDNRTGRPTPRDLLEMVATGQTARPDWLYHEHDAPPAQPAEERAVVEALEACERVFGFDLKRMITFGDDYNQAVRDAYDKVLAALSRARTGSEAQNG